MIILKECDEFVGTYVEFSIESGLSAEHMAKELRKFLLAIGYSYTDVENMIA